MEEIVSEIKSILIQDNYRIVNGKLEYLDSWGSWGEPPTNKSGECILDSEDFGKRAYDWKLVEQAMKVDVAKIKKGFKKMDVDIKIDDMQLPTGTEVFIQEVVNPQPVTITINHQRTKLDGAKIQMIRKLLSEGKKPAEIAKTLPATLHSVMYVVKKINAGQKLRNEK